MAIGTPATLGSSTSTGVQSSNTLTLAHNIQTGDLVVVAVEIQSNLVSIPTVSSMSDGTNNYSFAQRFNGTIAGIDIDTEMWYCANCSAIATSTVLTATWSGSNAGAGTSQSIQAARVSGIATSSPLDAAPTPQNGTASSPTLATGTLAQAAEAIFGFVWCGAGNAIGQASGFTNLSTTSQSGFTSSLDYDVVSSTNSVTYGPTNIGTAGETLIVTSFKGAGSGASPIFDLANPLR